VFDRTLVEYEFHELLEYTMQKLLAAMCALSLVLLPLSYAPAADNVKKISDNLVEVVVSGQGTTEDEALRDAKRKAVEQGAGAYIFSRSETKDFTLVKDTVLARSAGFVQGFDVLSKKKMEDDTFEIRIKAVVSIKGIEDTWGVVTNLLQERGRPKIMVALTEKIDGHRQEDSTVQTRAENLLLKSGFLLVNKEQLKAIDQKDLQAAVAEDNPAKVQAIAKRFGAQLFITGSTNAVKTGSRPIYGVLTHIYGANGDIKCYRSDTAQLLASQNATSESADQNVMSAAKKSLNDLGHILCPKVQGDILRFWQDALEGRGEVQLQIEGIKFADYLKLKNALKQIKQVKDVTAKFSNGIAECSIQSDVTAEQLAEKIAEALKGVEITDVSQNVIKAKAGKE